MRSSAWAALRLMINSKRVGCSMGMSAGLAPRRILSTWPTDLRMISSIFGPYEKSAPFRTQEPHPVTRGSLFLAAKSRSCA